MSTRSTIFYLDLGGTRIHIYRDASWNDKPFIEVESDGNHGFVTPMHPEAEEAVKKLQKEFRRWSKEAEEILEKP